MAAFEDYSREFPACVQYFSWTAESKHILAKYVHRNSAYKKTDLSMKAKFEIVLHQLKQKPEFHGLNITWNALQTTFKRDRDAILLKSGSLFLNSTSSFAYNSFVRFMSYPPKLFIHFW